MDKVDSLTDMIGSLMCCAPPRRLLRSTWYDKVAEQCSHRQGLEALDTLDNLDLRHWRGLDLAEAALAHDSVRSVEHPMIVEITGFCIVLVPKTCVSNGVSIQL